MKISKKILSRSMEAAAASFQSGQYHQAAALCKRILSAFPGHTGALGMLGVISAMKGDFKDAIHLFERAIKQGPTNVALNKNLAKALISSGNTAEGIKYYAKVAAWQPGNSEAQYDLACAYQKLEDWDNAEPHFRNALSINPGSVNALTNLGGVFRVQGRYEEAVHCYLAALSHVPDMQEALVNLGLTRQELGELESAQTTLEKAIQLYPSDADAHVNLAFCHLLKGDYRNGWQAYEWRWKRSNKQARDFYYPRWNGSSLSGCSILVYAEQGIGDEIMFASCLPDIHAHAEHLVIDCEPRLATLFSRSFPGATVHGGYQNESSGWLHDINIDRQIPIGSLPRYLRNTVQEFPQSKSYLLADPTVLALWKKRLDTLGKGLKIGLSWRGGGTLLSRKTRSIELAYWEEIIGKEGTSFVSLQYGDCEEEIAEVQKSTGAVIHTFPEIDPLTELETFAALISSLDLVITIDNSTAHLAGALGVPTWLLLPPVPDWRWTMEEEKTPWYPSMTLFRSQKTYRWASVLKQVADKLDTLVESVNH